MAINQVAHDLLTKMFQTRQRGVDWVFPSHSKSGHLEDVRRTFKTILEKAEITDFRLHDLRRTAASYMINSGASLQEVKEVLGHSDLRSTQVYARLSTRSMAKASDIMSQKNRKGYERLSCI